MELVILHTNDTHGQLTPVADLAGRSLGGYARRATFVRQQREQPTDLLLLDAGDLYQGSRYWHAFRGEADIELMNLLGYDAAALGNHDTDAGLEVLSARIREARFPVMCANMRFPNSHPLCDLWKPYHVVEVNGARVAIFNMLIDAMELYPAAFRESVEVRPYVDVASELVPHLRRQA
ncbi:MAG: metallophosphoesterase, partial [Anaerolineae bacterium]